MPWTGTYWDQVKTREDIEDFIAYNPNSDVASVWEELLHIEEQDGEDFGIEDFLEEASRVIHDGGRP